jgi:hypothetical protein
MPPVISQSRRVTADSSLLMQELHLYLPLSANPAIGSSVKPLWQRHESHTAKT